MSSKAFTAKFVKDEPLTDAEEARLQSYSFCGFFFTGQEQRVPTTNQNLIDPDVQRFHLERRNADTTGAPLPLTSRGMRGRGYRFFIGGGADIMSATPLHGGGRWSLRPPATQATAASPPSSPDSSVTAATPPPFSCGGALGPATWGDLVVEYPPCHTPLRLRGSSSTKRQARGLVDRG
eukprot:g9578.t1